jgi:hypothetical protein
MNDDTPPRKSMSLGTGLYQLCWHRESVKDIAATVTLGYQASESPQDKKVMVTLNKKAIETMATCNRVD